MNRWSVLWRPVRVRLPLGMVLLSMSAAGLPARADDAPPLPEWTLSTDGSHLRQRSTGLLWPRCAQGMRWTGRDCAGQALLLDLPQAQALARQRSRADGKAWRLPHLAELQPFARMAAAQPATTRPGIPESAQGWAWSATPPVQIQSVNPYRYGEVMKGTTGSATSELKFLHGWAVNTATGEARSDVLKRTPMMVWLVRRAD